MHPIICGKSRKFYHTPWQTNRFFKVKVMEVDGLRGVSFFNWVSFTFKMLMFKGVVVSTQIQTSSIGSSPPQNKYDKKKWKKLLKPASLWYFMKCFLKLKKALQISTELVSWRAINQLAHPANMDVPFFSKGFAMKIDKHAQRSILGRAWFPQLQL